MIPSTLISDMISLINNVTFSDVTFKVDGTIVHANKAILASRSEHFKSMLFGPLSESKKDCIELYDVSHSGNEIFYLFYLFCFL